MLLCLNYLDVFTEADCFSLLATVVPREDATIDWTQQRTISWLILYCDFTAHRALTLHRFLLWFTVATAFWPLNVLQGKVVWVVRKKIFAVRYCSRCQYGFLHGALPGSAMSTCFWVALIIGNDICGRSKHSLGVVDNLFLILLRIIEIGIFSIRAEACL